MLGNIDNLTLDSLKTYNCENVIFHGFKDEFFMNNLYHASQLGISPSFLDPCPNTVVEMLSCGLPVLTTKASGAYELVNFYDDFSVNENFNVDYYELQRFDKLPRIDYNEWNLKITNIIENEKFYKEKAREIFTKNLDIIIIAEKYLKFIDEIRS